MQQSKTKQNKTKQQQKPSTGLGQKFVRTNSNKTNKQTKGVGSSQTQNKKNNNKKQTNKQTNKQNVSLNVWLNHPKISTFFYPGKVKVTAIFSQQLAERIGKQCSEIILE